MADTSNRNVANQKPAGVPDTPRKQDHNPGVRHHRAGEPTLRQPVPGHVEMRQQAGPKRKRSRDDHCVAGRREVLADVHEGQLDRKQAAQVEERLPFVPRHVEGPARPQRPNEHHDSADYETQPAESQRRRIFEPRLDGDRIAAPKRREKQGEQTAAQRSAAGAGHRWQTAYPDRVSGQSTGLWCPWFGVIFNRKGQ